MLKVAIGVLISAIVLQGLGMLPGGAASSGMLSNIKGDNNAVVIIGAEAYGLAPEKFEAALGSALSKTSSQRAIQSSLDATAPAREQGAAIEFEGDDGIAVPVLSKKTAASLPSSVEKEDASEDSIHLNVRVKLRASDYDSAVKGWAGSIPGIVDSRTRLIFSSESEAAKAAFRPEFDADVTVTYSSPVHDRAVLVIVDKVH